MRTIAQFMSILALAGSILLATSGFGMAAGVACAPSQRELLISNHSPQDLWIGGGGGALRSVCVVNASTSCLAAADTINSTTGACSCGTQQGTLACPGTAQSTGPNANGGLNCACTTDAQCGPGAGCNTNTNFCYFLLPTNPVAHSGGANPFTWELTKSASPPQRGGWAEFCLDQASVTWQSTTIPSEVWWSGGIFARTGCKPDGTNCTTGDCSASPNSNCGAGVGGSNPATVAEFTLQSQANDFYDITVINGANTAEEMVPIPAPTATPGSVSEPYWCKAPGLKTALGGKCDWDFIQYTRNVHYPEGEVKNYTALLLSSSKPCSTANTPNGCPSSQYTCSGAPGGCYLECTPGVANTCPTNLECLPSQDGKNYCQCSKEIECAGKGYCGTQFIPGKGIFLQQCGNFDGWWSADDFCAGFPSYTVGPLKCGDLITDGNGSSQTNLASLFACAAKGGSSPGNTTSCYNDGTAQTYPSTCCGWATYAQGNPDGLSKFWPKNGTSKCASVNGNRANDVVWDSQIQPWLVNLKRACPTAYSYPYDDPTSTFQCRGKGTTNTLGYDVLFLNLPKPPAP